MSDPHGDLYPDVQHLNEEVQNLDIIEVDRHQDDDNRDIQVEDNQPLVDRPPRDDDDRRSERSTRSDLGFDIGRTIDGDMGDLLPLSFRGVRLLTSDKASPEAKAQAQQVFRQLGHRDVVDPMFARSCAMYFKHSKRIADREEHLLKFNLEDVQITTKFLPETKESDLQTHNDFKFLEKTTKVSNGKPNDMMGFLTRFVEIINKGKLSLRQAKTLYLMFFSGDEANTQKEMVKASLQSCILNGGCDVEVIFKVRNDSKLDIRRNGRDFNLYIFVGNVSTTRGKVTSCL